jgi:membrane protein implicated in regulation of membrane protease activity
MTRAPVFALWLGYGPAALAAAAAAAAGWGWVPVVALFWIGGAAATLLAAVAIASRRATREAGHAAAQDAGEDADGALAEAMRRWEDERLGRDRDATAGAAAPHANVARRLV